MRYLTMLLLCLVVGTFAYADHFTLIVLVHSDPDETSDKGVFLSSLERELQALEEARIEGDVVQDGPAQGPRVSLELEVFAREGYWVAAGYVSQILGMTMDLVNAPNLKGTGAWQQYTVPMTVLAIEPEARLAAISVYDQVEEYLIDIGLFGASDGIEWHY
ncbi:MAG: hypothetical protein E4H09_01075 [Spirochaetales bacterium]|nr:MAG: hypothetical protein E4H09_01075 [Spirochaetales bacterium]